MLDEIQCPYPYGCDKPWPGTTSVSDSSNPCDDEIQSHTIRVEINHGDLDNQAGEALSEHVKGFTRPFPKWGLFDRVMFWLELYGAGLVYGSLLLLIGLMIASLVRLLVMVDGLLH